ncbi:MAG: NYN domain-containing protein [Gammaproteobacteria bacterium]|nr:NYN domain-containing protein [Gammaproteobacteria bacterium]
MQTSTLSTVPKLAVLIDADNVSPRYIKSVLDEIAKYGTANVKRVYGNWTSAQMGKWKEVLLQHSLQPRQQFNYIPKKNATDIALVIEAMDLLHAGNLDGFCLVSSDCDFTPLASRIREAGLIVYGFGENKTSDAFGRACDKFVPIEGFHLADDESSAGGSKSAKDSGPGSDVIKNQSKSGKRVAQSKPERNSSSRKELRELGIKFLEEVVSDSVTEDGWVLLSEVGSIAMRRVPEFDCREFGYNKLLEFVEDSGNFDIKKVGEEGGPQTVYVALKSADK